MKKALTAVLLGALVLLSAVIAAHSQETSPLPAAKTLTAISVVITPVQGGIQMQATRAFSDGSTKSDTDPVKTLDEGIDAAVKWMMGEKSLPAVKPVDVPKKK